MPVLLRSLKLSIVLVARGADGQAMVAMLMLFGAPGPPHSDGVRSEPTV